MVSVGVPKTTSTALSTGAFLPWMPGGRIHTAPLTSFAANQFSGAVNTPIGHQIRVPNAIGLASVSVNVTQSSAAGQILRLWIYADSGAFQPTTLLWADSFNPVATGVLTAACTLSFVAPANIWLLWSSAVTSTSARFDSHSSSRGVSMVTNFYGQVPTGSTDSSTGPCRQFPAYATAPGDLSAVTHTTYGFTVPVAWFTTA